MTLRASDMHLEAATCMQLPATPVTVHWAQLHGRCSWHYNSRYICINAPDEATTSHERRLFAVGCVDGALRVCAAHEFGVGLHIRPRIERLWQRRHKQAVRRARFDHQVCISRTNAASR